MYLPAAFKEDRLDILHDAIRRAGLAMLVTMGTDGIDVSHVPLLLDAADGPNGTLHGHLARANAQWRTALPTASALAVFTGPDSYVSPSFYPSKVEHGKVVPTWNYVAIHARGTLRFFDDAEKLLAIVSRLTERHEAGRDQQWRVGDAPATFIRSQLKALVGFALRIDTLEGKWKMSQNRPTLDRAGVAAALSASPDAMDQEVAALVRP